MSIQKLLLSLGCSLLSLRCSVLAINPDGTGVFGDEMLVAVGSDRRNGQDLHVADLTDLVGTDRAKVVAVGHQHLRTAVSIRVPAALADSEH